jgi:ring-1,2-phenylacetyl-CoA epoxidase subunit PaaE
MSEYYNLKVKDVLRETDDAVTIQLKQPLFRKIKYEPGQFLTVVLNIDGKQVRRAYSMSSAPTLDSHLAFTVKRVAGGLASNYLNDRIAKGDSIEIMKPMGKFCLSPDKSKQRHIVLVGGGSGITPLMSILKSTLFFEPGSVVSLVYANSNEDCIIFKQQLDDLQARFGERLKVVHVLSKPKRMHPGYSGRLDDAMLVNIVNLLPKFDANSTEYFVCGPEGLMAAAKDALKRLKVPNARVHTESFTASAEDTTLLGTVEAKQVTVRLRGQDHQVFVPADKSILDAGLDAGLDMPFSCQSGLCTACMGKCLQGEVKMTAGDGLSEDEIKQGFRLLCVGHPMTDDVVVEVD